MEPSDFERILKSAREQGQYCGHKPEDVGRRENALEKLKLENAETCLQFFFSVFCSTIFFRKKFHMDR